MIIAIMRPGIIPANATNSHGNYNKCKGHSLLLSGQGVAARSDSGVQIKKEVNSHGSGARETVLPKLLFSKKAENSIPEEIIESWPHGLNHLRTPPHPPTRPKTLLPLHIPSGTNIYAILRATIFSV